MVCNRISKKVSGPAKNDLGNNLLNSE